MRGLLRLNAPNRPGVDQATCMPLFHPLRVPTSRAESWVLFELRDQYCPEPRRRIGSLGSLCVPPCDDFEGSVHQNPSFVLLGLLIVSCEICYLSDLFVGTAKR